MGKWADRRAKRTISDEVYTRLSRMYQAGCGRSRQADKAAGIDGQYIYSSKTYETYKRESKHYVSWLRTSHPEVKHLRQGKQYINEYLQTQIDHGYSAWTITTRKAALGKLYGISTAEMIATPPRERENIVRSRYRAARDAHISAQKREYLSMLGCSTGLRRREMEQITGNDLVERNNRYFLHVTRGTKGGKERWVIVHGRTPEETAQVVKIFQQAGSLRVCPHLHSAFDEHACRAEYARQLYQAVARPVDAIPKSDRYIMRKDRAGEVLDREAMRVVSRALGHNRVDVVAEHYLYSPMG